MPYLKPDDYAAVKAALNAGIGMCENALPQFDWGKSPLSGAAIQSLNETPGELKTALALVTKAEGYVVSPGLRELAVELYGNDKCEIDDEGASTSPTDDGTWVQAWVWVSREQMIDAGLIPQIACGQCEGTGTIKGGLSGDGADEECPVCDGDGMIDDEDGEGPANQ